MNTLTLSPQATVVEFATQFRPALESMLSRGPVEIVIGDESLEIPGLKITGTFREGRLVGVNMVDLQTGKDRGPLTSGGFYNYCITCAAHEPFTLRSLA